MFTREDAIIYFISYILGGLLILIGAFKCIKNYLDVKKDNSISSKEMIIGIFLIVIGLVFIFLASIITELVRIIIGGWILFIGINRLINSLRLNKKTKKFIIFLVLSILLITAGLYTILKANLAIKAVGIVLMIYSFIEILGYIFDKQTTYTSNTTIIDMKEEKIEATLLVEEQTSKTPNKSKNKKKH
jgi:uncharacterized membrane protein HdeD (DUF308 family)